MDKYDWFKKFLFINIDKFNILAIRYYLIVKNRLTFYQITDLINQIFNQ